MTAPNKYELHVRSMHGAEKVAMDFAANIAKSMNFPPERVEDLKTAVAEACMNAIEHGNKLDSTTRVGIRLLVDKDKLQIAVQDQGRGVAELQPPDIESRMEGKIDPRGWGIFLIENLVDEVTFESTAEGGVVKMIIYLEKQE